MNEHVNLMVEQYGLEEEQGGEFIRFTGRVCQNIQGGQEQRKVDVQSITSFAVHYQNIYYH